MAGGVFLALSLTWLLPLLHFSGGLETYLQAARQQSKMDIWRWPSYGIVVGVRNLSSLAAATGIGLHVLVPILIAFLLRFFPLADARATWEKWFVFWWIVPSVLVYSLHYGQPGYVLVYLPVILVYLPSVIRGFLDDLKVRIQRDTGRSVQFRTQRALVTTLAVVGALNLALFLHAPWEASAHSIALHDMQWQSILALRDDFRSDSTIVLTGFFSTGSFRHASYYLPEYLVYSVGADDEVGVYGWVFRTRYKEPSYNLSHIELHETIELSSGIRHVLILDQTIAAASDMRLTEIPLAPGSSAYVLDLGTTHAADRLIFEDHQLKLR